MIRSWGHRFSVALWSVTWAQAIPGYHLKQKTSISLREITDFLHSPYHSLDLNELYLFSTSMYSFTLAKNDLVLSELAYAVSQIISLPLEARNSLNNQSKYVAGQLICDFLSQWMLVLPPDCIILMYNSIWHTLEVKRELSTHYFHSYEVIQVNPPFLLPEIKALNLAAVFYFCLYY